MKSCACGSNSATTAALKVMTAEQLKTFEQNIKDCLTCRYDRASGQLPAS